MRKTVYIFGTYKALDESIERLEEIRDQYEQKIKFLKKQSDDLFELLSKENESAWSEIKNGLKANKLLPKIYNKKEHTLSIDHELGILTMETTSDMRPSLEDMMRKYLGR